MPDTLGAIPINRHSYVGPSLPQACNRHISDLIKIISIEPLRDVLMRKSDDLRFSHEQINLRIDRLMG